MKLDTNKRKKFRVSNKVKKVAKFGRFRLSISRSAKNISAQIIDDAKNMTLLSASSIEKDIKSNTKVNKIELSKIRDKSLIRISWCWFTASNNWIDFSDKLSNEFSFFTLIIVSLLISNDFGRAASKIVPNGHM